MVGSVCLLLPGTENTFGRAVTRRQRRPVVEVCSTLPTTVQPFRSSSRTSDFHGVNRDRRNRHGRIETDDVNTLACGAVHLIVLFHCVFCSPSCRPVAILVDCNVDRDVDFKLWHFRSFGQRIKFARTPAGVSLEFHQLISGMRSGVDNTMQPLCFPRTHGDSALQCFDGPREFPKLNRHAIPRHKLRLHRLL